MTTPDPTPTAQGESLPARTRHARAHNSHGPPWLYALLSAAITFCPISGMLWMRAERKHDEMAQRLAERDKELQAKAARYDDLEKRLGNVIAAMTARPAATSTDTPPAPADETAPELVPPPAIRLHTMQDGETISELGYRFCGIARGNRDAEQSFLHDVLALNRRGVKIGDRTRPIHSIAQLNIVHTGEHWRFPASCKPRLDNSLKLSSQP